jgi:hypothetical protein
LVVVVGDELDHEDRASGAGDAVVDVELVRLAASMSPCVEATWRPVISWTWARAPSSIGARSCRRGCAGGDVEREPARGGLDRSV